VGGGGGREEHGAVFVAELREKTHGSRAISLIMGWTRVAPITVELNQGGLNVFTVYLLASSPPRVLFQREVYTYVMYLHNFF